MDYSLPVVSDDGDLSWSDNRSVDSMGSMGSDDGQSMMLSDSPPEWVDHPAHATMPISIPTSVSTSQTGQLSPVSNGMDSAGYLADDGAYVSGTSAHSHHSMMLQSGFSSRTESWNTDYLDDEDDDDAAAMGHGGVAIDCHWEHGSDDVTVPKLEPLDDDEVRLDDVKQAPSALVPGEEASGVPSKVKRPRGRPRKHPLNTVVATNKVTKGRSKTGCLTCRKRKKKCDEAKPRCMNCEKNSVFCEGYPEKQIWKSGKERAEEERLKSHALPNITMQPIFHGLETAEDRIFWKHYNEHLSSVLTVEGEHKNAFKDMIIPAAVKHHGLMHSILSLSSKHIDYDTPYGLNILRHNPSATLESLQQRSDYHHDTAIKKLRENFARQVDKSSPEYKDVLFGRYGQMLCFILESMVEGNPGGSHRYHLKAYQSLIQESPPEDPAFLAFVTEFFQYHIFADELLRLDDDRMHRLDSEHWIAPIHIHSPRLLGVADGLFKLMSQITSIRNTIRYNMAHHIDPVVDYTSLYQADGIHAAIQDWAPHFPPGDSRDLVGLLYKQMMWIYLFRTVYPPSPSPASPSACLPLHAHSAPSLGGFPSAIVNTPPVSATSSCASSPALPASASEATGAVFNLPAPGSSQPYGKNSSADDAFVQNQQHQGTRVNSPEPIRQPVNHDPRITVAVEESLFILEKFKPSDPSQTLLLMPCLIIGSACFTPSQQDRVRTAIRTVRGYTGLRHTYRVAELLDEVWRLMEIGDWVTVWDWQRVARGLDVDFLI